MNKSIPLVFFTFLIIFSSGVLACDFCYVKNIECPTTVNVGEKFTISFEYSGTGPDYQYEYTSLLLDGNKIDCSYSDVSACIWNKKSFTTTAPSSPGVYTYTARCYAGDEINSGNCDMEDDATSCKVNVVSGLSAAPTSGDTKNVDNSMVNFGVGESSGLLGAAPTVSRW